MRLAFANAAAVPAGVWAWAPEITPQEWADRESGEIVVETDFMDRLVALRRDCAFPFIFNSCYRTPAHNLKVSAVKSDDGPHVLALAADIRIYGARALTLLDKARARGFSGIGVAQKLGDPVEQRYVHLDMAPNRPQAPRPLLWSY
jgi:uncharacterized protein YcbK (DUF882 family)